MSKYNLVGSGLVLQEELPGILRKQTLLTRPVSQHKGAKVQGQMSYPHRNVSYDHSTQSMWALGEKKDLKLVDPEVSLWKIKFSKLLQHNAKY